MLCSSSREISFRGEQIWLTCAIGVAVGVVVGNGAMVDVGEGIEVLDGNAGIVGEEDGSWLADWSVQAAIKITKQQQKRLRFNLFTNNQYLPICGSVDQERFSFHIFFQVWLNKIIERRKSKKSSEVCMVYSINRFTTFSIYD